MYKLAYAQELLRKLYEKRAGLALPIAAGAGLAIGAHTIKKTVNKASEYHAGFSPNQGRGQ